MSKEQVERVALATGGVEVFKRQYMQEIPEHIDCPKRCIPERLGKCPECNGSGFGGGPHGVCHECHGTGQVRE